MTDNTLQTGSATIATDEIGGVHHQKVKVEFGASDSATQVSSSDPLPTAAISMPAADRTTDSIAATQQTGAIMQANTVRIPAFAAIAVSASGPTAVVGSQGGGNKIRVLALNLVVNAAVNVKWQGGSTDKTGLWYFGGQGHGVVLPFTPTGWFETAAAEALNINLSGAVAVGGSLVYIVVT